MQQLTITRPDDWHLHLRDGALMQAVVQDTARQFARAIVMPNLRPPVTTTGQAQDYCARILAALPHGAKSGGAKFEPLMTLYLTDNTTAQEIQRAKQSGIVHAVKLYPAGATTNFRCRCDRHPKSLSGAGRDAALRHAVAGAW